MEIRFNRYSKGEIVGEYILKPDNCGYMVGIVGTVKEGPREGEETIGRPLYPSSLESACTLLLEKQISTSDATDIEALRADVIKSKNEITDTVLAYQEFN